MNTLYLHFYLALALWRRHTSKAQTWFIANIFFALCPVERRQWGQFFTVASNARTYDDDFAGGGEDTGREFHSIYCWFFSGTTSMADFAWFHDVQCSMRILWSIWHRLNSRQRHTVNWTHPMSCSGHTENRALCTCTSSTIETQSCWTKTMDNFTMRMRRWDPVYFIVICIRKQYSLFEFLMHVVLHWCPPLPAHCASLCAAIDSFGTGETTNQTICSIPLERHL